mgnify:FL=1
MRNQAKEVRILPQFLYIEPTSVCNLHCTMCYTNVINGPARRVLESEQILGFVRRFVASTPSPISLYWCGTGEVFLHPGFPGIVNTLLDEFGDSMEQIIQTNGTMRRRLREFSSLSRLNFRVSIEGRKEAHERMRGQKTYDRTIEFCRAAVEGGCRSLAVRTLLTRDNIMELDEFYAELRDRIGPQVQLLLSIAYPNRLLRPLRAKALAIVQHDINDSTLLQEAEARQILAERYDNRFAIDDAANADSVGQVDNYLSLNTYGVYSCCHGIIKLGEPEQDIGVLYERMRSTEAECRSCSMFPCQ